MLGVADGVTETVIDGVAVVEGVTDGVADTDMVGLGVGVGSITKLADLAMTNPALSVVITAPDSKLNILLFTNLLYLFILLS